MQFTLFPSRRCHRPRSKKGMGTEMRSSFLVGERSFFYLSAGNRHNATVVVVALSPFQPELARPTGQFWNVSNASAPRAHIPNNPRTRNWPGDRGVGYRTDTLRTFVPKGVVRGQCLVPTGKRLCRGGHGSVCGCVLFCLERGRDEDYSVHGDEWLLGLLQRPLHALCIGLQGFLTQDEASNAGLCVLQDLKERK